MRGLDLQARGARRLRWAALCAVVALVWPSAAVAALSRPHWDAVDVAGYGTAFGISANGRYVLFVTSNPKLVSGGANGKQDLFVRDMWLGRVEKVNVPSAGWRPGSHSPYGFGGTSARMSADGRYVVFTDTEPNLVPRDSHYDSESYEADAFLRDRVRKTTVRLNEDANGNRMEFEGWMEGSSANEVAISADGSKVAYTIHRYAHEVYPVVLVYDVASHATVATLPDVDVFRACDFSLSADGSYLPIEQVWEGPGHLRSGGRRLHVRHHDRGARQDRLR